MKGPNEIIFEVHEADEGGYYAAATGYDIITQGDSWDDLKLMAQDAVLCHFDDDSAPRIIRLNLVKEEILVKSCPVPGNRAGRATTTTVW